MTAAAPRPLTTHVDTMEPTSPLARTVAVITGLFGLTLFIAGLVMGIRAGFDTRDSGYFFPLLVGLPYLAAAAVAWKHGSDHPGRWAWTAGAFSILGVVTSIVVIYLVYGAFGADPAEADSYTTGQAFVGDGAGWIVLAAAPIVTAFEAIQAYRLRRRERATA